MRLTAVALLLVFCVSVLAENQYDYYVLATEWAGTVCQEKKCTASSSSISKTFFNLHGLWPSKASGPLGPFNCDNVAWSAHYLTANTASLVEQYWNGLYGSQDDFHNHEWTKHGSCWNNDIKGVNPIDDYFKKAIELATRYNAYNILAKAGITPGKSYAVNQVVAALTAAYKPNSFGLNCSGKGIEELRLCLDKSYNVIACPGNVAKISCSGNVNFPAL